MAYKNVIEQKFVNAYKSARKRCSKPGNKSYKNYGDRGIKVMWNSYKDFKKDMYSDFINHCEEFGIADTTLDRINNDGDYSKENCRWATRSQQQRNKQNKKNNQSVIYEDKNVLILLIKK